MKFKAKPGAWIKDKDADLIGKTMVRKKVKSADGLLKIATPKSSPLHKYFNWDDSHAAHLYRLYQARTLIGSIVKLDVKTKKYVKEWYACDVIEKPYERHSVVLKQVNKQQFLENEAYNELLEICNRIEGIRLHLKKPKWKILIDFIRSNDPR